MAFDRDAHHAEVDRNFDAFKQALPDLMNSDKGRYVLLRHAAVVGIFDDRQAASHAGLQKFPDHFFSVQEVTDEPVDLGVISHVRFGTA